jgi:hypothetical protein
MRTNGKIIRRINISERASERIKTRNDPWIKRRCRESSGKVAQARQWSERNRGAQRAEARSDWEWLIFGDHHARRCCRHEPEQERRGERGVGGKDQHACFIGKFGKVPTCQEIMKR